MSEHVTDRRVSPVADGTGRVHRGGGRVPVEVVVEPFGEGPVAESFAAPQLEDRGNHRAVTGERVWMACLCGERLYRIGLDGRSAEVLLVGEYGRLRIARAPDGSVWVLTSNHDGRGSPTRNDDRILRLVA